MTCVHKVRWSVKRPEDCRFRLSVSHYKDRIVAPDEYSGATEVTPSDETQVLPTTDKLVRDDITVNPAPTEILSTDHNGTFTPSDGHVGFSQVDVNVQPDGFDGYNRVEVSVEGQWIDYDDVPVALPEEYQRVEYIESSGTQFIELPIGFYPTDKISIKGANPNVNSADKYLVSPKRWNNDNNRFAMFGFNRDEQNTNTYILGYGNLGTGHTSYKMAITPNSDFHRFHYADRISVCPDLAIAIGVANIVFGSETANLKLFYGYNSNTAGKICYYIHEKADGRKIALFACYRKADGVIGMYDVENDVFYTNDGTGGFTKGQDI